MWNREQDKVTLRGSPFEGWEETGRNRKRVAKNISGRGNSICRGPEAEAWHDGRAERGLE
jgi:hypothetical protein